MRNKDQKYEIIMFSKPQNPFNCKKKKIQIEIFASILHLGKPTMKSTQFQLHVNVRKCRWIELSSSTSQVLLQ